MALDRSNFFSPKDPKTVATPAATKVVEGPTPVTQHAEKINPGQQSNGPTDFGKGVTSPGSRIYNDSNRS